MIHQTKTLKYRLQSGIFPKLIYCCINQQFGFSNSEHAQYPAAGNFGSSIGGTMHRCGRRIFSRRPIAMMADPRDLHLCWRVRVSTKMVVLSNILNTARLLLPQLESKHQHLSQKRHTCAVHYVMK